MPRQGASARGPWALHSALRQVLARFRAGCESVPADRWRQWWTTLAIGYLLVLLLMAGQIAAVRTATAAGSLEWEATALRWLAARPHFSFSTAIWLQTFGTDITLVYIVLFGAGVAAWARLPLRALTIVAAYLLTDIVVRIGWLMGDRTRPTLILDGIAAPGFDAFPSGHAAKSVAVYGILACLWAGATSRWAERGLALTLAAVIPVLVMAGRLRMGVHWPSDIIAGAITGAASLGVLVTALRRAEPRIANRRPGAPRSTAPPVRGASRGSPPPGNSASA